MIVKPLYGHVSQESALVIGDYPYGRKLRCRIRFWLEFDAKRGYRFCSQTEHPTTKVWNAPKKSTYMRVAANMYLDEQNHVAWSGIHEYSSAEDALTFTRDFPQSDAAGLAVWAKMKAKYARMRASGDAKWAINGVVQKDSDEDIARYAAEALVWDNVSSALEVKS